MTADALLIIRTLFAQSWRIFNGWTIPGINLTPAAYLMGIVCIWFAVRNLKRVFGADVYLNGDDAKSVKLADGAVRSVNSRVRW